MANNFIENFRNTPFGVQRQPWEQINSGFSRIINSRNTEPSNTPIDKNSKMGESPSPIRLLEIEENGNGIDFSTTVPDSFAPPMKIWRLDGQPLNMNSYLDKLGRLKEKITLADDIESISKAMEEGSNDWFFNNHVLGHTFSRAEGVPDETVGSVLKRYVADIKTEPYYKKNTLPDIKAELKRGIDLAFVPKELRGEKRA